MLNIIWALEIVGYEEFNKLRLFYIYKEMFVGRPMTQVVIRHLGTILHDRKIVFSQYVLHFENEWENDIAHFAISDPLFNNVTPVWMRVLFSDV